MKRGYKGIWYKGIKETWRANRAQACAPAELIPYTFIPLKIIDTI